MVAEDNRRRVEERRERQRERAGKEKEREREICREQHQTNSRWLLGLNAFPGIGSIYRVSQKSRVALVWVLRGRIERNAGR